MLKLILRRILATAPILLGVSIVAFLLMRLVPGDIILTLLGPYATEETAAQLRAHYGLDLPIWEQYWNWLVNVVTGDFGRSIASQVLVADLLGARVVNTMILTLASAILAIAFGFLGGTLAAARRFSVFDRAITLIALIAASAPTSNGTPVARVAHSAPSNRSAPFRPPLPVKRSAISS